MSENIRYKFKKIQLFFYLVNVLGDPRLPLEKRLVDREGPDPTTTPEVQAYAKQEELKQRIDANARRGNLVPVNTILPKDDIWVMKFVQGENFGRYCLIPLETHSVLERLELALDHLDASMNELNMRISRRHAAREESEDAPEIPEEAEIDQHLIKVKRWYVERLNMLIEWVQST